MPYSATPGDGGRCNCESGFCEDGGMHEASCCPSKATVPCQYIGPICGPCTDVMRAYGGEEYLNVPTD